METPRFSAFQESQDCDVRKKGDGLHFLGVLLVYYVDMGHTITGAFYADLLIQLREKIRQIRRGKLPNGVLFHQDNAPAHTSTVAMAAIQKCGFQLVEDPPYSPDLVPSDYYLFPEMKKELSGHHFARNDDVMNTLDHNLRNQNGAFYTELSVLM